MRLNGIERASVEKHVEIQPRLHTDRHPHSYLCIPLTVQDPTQQRHEKRHQRLVIPPAHTSQTSHPAGGAGGGHTDRDAVSLGDSACDERPKTSHRAKAHRPTCTEANAMAQAFPEDEEIHRHVNQQQQPELANASPRFSVRGEL